MDKEIERENNVTKILKQRHPELFREDLAEKVANIEKTLQQMAQEKEQVKQNEEAIKN